MAATHQKPLDWQRKTANGRLQHLHNDARSDPMPLSVSSCPLCPAAPSCGQCVSLCHTASHASDAYLVGIPTFRSAYQMCHTPSFAHTLCRPARPSPKHNKAFISETTSHSPHDAPHPSPVLARHVSNAYPKYPPGVSRERHAHTSSCSAHSADHLMGLATFFERKFCFEILDHFWPLRNTNSAASAPEFTLYHKGNKGVS